MHAIVREKGIGVAVHPDFPTATTYSRPGGIQWSKPATVNDSTNFTIFIEYFTESYRSYLKKSFIPGEGRVQKSGVGKGSRMT